MKKDNENLYVWKRMAEKASFNLFKGGLIFVAVDIILSIAIDCKNRNKK